MLYLELDQYARPNIELHFRQGPRPPQNNIKALRDYSHFKLKALRDRA